MVTLIRMDLLAKQVILFLSKKENKMRFFGYKEAGAQERELNRNQFRGKDSASIKTTNNQIFGEATS